MEYWSMLLFITSNCYIPFWRHTEERVWDIVLISLRAVTDELCLFINMDVICGQRPDFFRARKSY